MWKKSILMAVGGAMFALEANACSCVPCAEKSLKDRSEFDHIFAGEVISERKTNWWEDFWTRIWNPLYLHDNTVYTFQTLEVVKGEVGNQISVRTSSSLAECGAQFIVGSTVAVVTRQRKDGAHVTNSCLQMCWEEEVNQALLTTKTVNTKGQ